MPSDPARGVHRARAPLATDRLTGALGWASLGLALPPLLEPDRVAAALGVGRGAAERTAMTAVGARELVAAAGLLLSPSPFWLWARVGGDAVDLALLGRALRRRHGRGRDRQRLGTATAAAVGIAALDAYAAATRTRKGTEVEMVGTTTVNRTPADVYAFWRRLDALPTFLAHLDEVSSTGDRTSHWRATAPFGRGVEWDAELTEDVPGERIAWRSLPGARVRNEGVVRFAPAPGGRGTELRVTLRYALPGGRLAAAVARYFGEEPHQQLDDDLRRAKQVLETGEVVRSEGAPGGKRARREFPQHPARPLTPAELRKEVQA